MVCVQGSPSWGALPTAPQLVFTFVVVGGLVGRVPAAGLFDWVRTHCAALQLVSLLYVDLEGGGSFLLKCRLFDPMRPISLYDIFAC
jgi:hypothetical protein